MAVDGVKLLGMRASPFVRRIEMALKPKGIDNEYIEEDLVNKSERLLKCNPIHKKVPVLLHGDKPLPESLIIRRNLEGELFIIALMREPWRVLGQIILMRSPGFQLLEHFLRREEQMKTLNEAQESLKPLEELLKGKRFFGGETIGYLDIVIGCITVLVPVLEELLGLTYVDPNAMPLFHAWSQEFTNVPLVKERLPPREKWVHFRKGFGRD